MAIVAILPMVVATDTGVSTGITVNTQKFAPRVWLCGERTTRDDHVENGANVLSLTERKHNYAFEGEKIHWDVLVMDKNKIEDVKDVVATLGSSQGAGNDVEVECVRNTDLERGRTIPGSCNAKIDQYNVTTLDPAVMGFYECTLTVETPNSMHGEYFITVEAKDGDGLTGIMAENEYWFLNPTIALSTDGNIAFGDANGVMPGTTAYSQTVLVGNDAEAGSGVILDMFISGTDFYDPASDGARCPWTNQLKLTNFRYFVTNGAFSSLDAAVQAAGETDQQGYTSIPYSTDISGAERIMRFNTTPRGASPSSSVVDTDWNNGNALSPGSEMALTFKLSMPEPCIGDFSEGKIYFWGEAI